MSMIRKAVVALIAVSALTVMTPGRAEAPDSVKEGHPTVVGSVVDEARARFGQIVTALTTPRVIDLKELQCLAKNIFYESASEPEEGKVAVGLVTLNRVEDGRFGSSVCKVVTQPRQFSWVGQRNKKPREDDPRWIESQRVATELLGGTDDYDHFKIKYEDALYFHATHVRPSWANQKKPIHRVGGHRFYGERVKAGDYPRRQEI